MKFASKPFAFIALLFLCGIILGDTFHIDKFTNIFILVFVIMAIITAFFRKFSKNVISGFLLSSFFFLGMVTIKQARSISLNNHALDRDTSYIMHVDEIASPTKEWRKAICTVQSVIDSVEVQPLSGRALIFLKSENIERGDQLLIHTQLNDIENKNNPGEFDAKSFWNNKNIYKIGFATEDDIRIAGHSEQFLIQSWLAGVQDYLTEILNEHLDEENLAIAQALVLGDKDLLSSEMRGSFSNAGAMHVLAVSGLHVGIILYILIFIFSQFPRLISKKTALITSVVLIWIYAGLTGFSPSVMRASFMFSMLAIGQLTGKRVNSLNILFFTAFVLLNLNPLFIYDIGFQLSYLAMLGILLFYKQVSTLFYIKNKWIQKIWEGTAVGIAAQLLTVPLTLFYFHQFPNYFMLTNVGMMVFAGLILGMGLLLFSINWIGPLASFIGILLGVSLSAMMFFVQFIEQLPGAVAHGFTLSGISVFLIYFFGLLVWVYGTKFKHIILPIIAVLVLFMIMQYDRYKNMNTKEIVVFNSNDLILTIKNKNHIICIHNFKDVKKKQLDFLIENYRKVRPGDVSFQKLIIGTTKMVFDKDTLSFIMNKHGLEIDGLDRKVFIRISYNDNAPVDARIIDMPYMHSDEENLKYGAVHLTFR